MKNNFKEKMAFTLAEVLITLGIIGIVSAMTIPTLINNYQKQQTLSKFKKVYATFANMAKLSFADGNIMGTNIMLGEDTFNTFFKPYLKSAELLYETEPIEYMPSASGNPSHIVYFYTGAYEYNASSDCSFRLSDGTKVLFMSAGNGQGVLTFDINGDEPPNKIGRDLFWLYLYLNEGQISQYHRIPGAYPPPIMEKEYVDYDCINGMGLFCGNKIIMDGWQIKDDYPW